MKCRPVLSFCIPTYNRADRAYHCVTHILQYPGDEIEVVVSDNASTDDTLERLGGINDKRLKVYSNTKNMLGLNWPLVVSYSAGSFAALMSDEDIVVLENIPYFIELLKEAHINKIGAVIYHFPYLVNIFNNYTTKNAYESLKLAIRHGGHITCHILNMDFFELLSDRDYEIASFENPHNEPQNEILLNLAEKSLVMLVKKPLCEYGFERIMSPKGDLDNFKYRMITQPAFSIERHCHEFLAYREHIIKGCDNTNSLSSERQKELLLISVVLRLGTSLSMWLGSIINIDPDNYDLSGFPSNRTEAVKMFIDFIETLFARSREVVKNSRLLQFYEKATVSVIKQNYRESIPDEFDFIERIRLGDFLFRLVQCFYLVFSFYGDGKLTSGYANDFDDILELKLTDRLYKMIQEKRFDDVINSTGISSPRANYLKGQACMYKGDYSKAEHYFTQFLEALSNANTLSDILTGDSAVSHSYYYLGIINQKKGDTYKALDFFEKSKKITDDLTIGAYLKPDWFNIEA